MNSIRRNVSMSWPIVIVTFALLVVVILPGTFQHRLDERLTLQFDRPRIARRADTMPGRCPASGNARQL